MQPTRDTRALPVGSARAPRKADDHATLLRTSLASLERFYLPDAGILARSAVWDGHTWRKTEASPENTTNALVALNNLRRQGLPVPLDPNALMQHLMGPYFTSLTYSDLAFMLWADTLGDQRHGAVIWKALLERLPAGVSQSIPMAWTLTALCHYHDAAAETGAVRRCAGELYRRIIANQAPSSWLFHGSGTRGGWRRSRSRTSTLSSQAYPIQALAVYGRVFGDYEAMERAERCLRALAARQGPLGQWWRRYDVESGAVVETYPVHSINQDTAVPLAWRELRQTLATREHDVAVARGLEWVFGANELGRRLVDEQAGVTWPGIGRENDRFEVMNEIFSYHPARSLVALCAAG